MVGMRVATGLVVGQHHVRPELAHRAHQRPGRLVQRGQCEAASRQRRLRVTLGQAGVDEAQETLVDAENFAGTDHLFLPETGQVLPHFRPVHRRIEDIAALAAR